MSQHYAPDTHVVGKLETKKKKNHKHSREKLGEWQCNAYVKTTFIPERVEIHCDALNHGQNLYILTCFNMMGLKKNLINRLYIRGQK